MDIKKNIQEFLEEINRANVEIEDAETGSEVYKAIRLDEKLGMFKLSSGNYVPLTAEKGSLKSESYYFKADEHFLGSIQGLEAKKYTAFVSPGFYVVERNRWDKTEEPLMNSGSAEISRLDVSASLRLGEDYRFQEYTFNPVRESEPIKLESSEGPIEEKDIREVIRNWPEKNGNGGNGGGRNGGDTGGNGGGRNGGDTGGEGK